MFLLGLTFLMLWGINCSVMYVLNYLGLSIFLPVSNSVNIAAVKVANI